MLNFGNKDFRNLQEQVLKNMDDIRYILEEEGVLNEFGIKVVGQVAALIDLPSVSEYKAAHSDWSYGDAYAVGDEAPYELYILTRANGTHPNDYWFEIGEFPVAGPQGPQGIQGNTGATPSISVAANTTTLSAGQSASVSVAKSGTAAEPLLTFSFEIPQGAQGIQGIQGIQGPVGQQGPQGIQGQKGDPGYLYTIVGQVNDAQHLPLPTTVSRDAAFLVGTQDPYDVYVIIGSDPSDFEWINLGEIATVVPNTFVLSDDYAESGTVDAQTLETINNQTNMYYLRNGDVFLGYAGKIAGVAYFMSLGYSAGNNKTEVGRVALNLSTGAWTINVSYVGDTPTNMVTTDTTQTITGSKTFGSVIKAGFTDVSLVGLNGVAGFRAYKPGTTTSAGQMIITNDGTVAGSYRAVIQAYNGTQDAYNTLRIGDTEGFKYYVNNTNVFTIGNNGTIYGDPTYTPTATGGIKIYADNTIYGENNSITMDPLTFTKNGNTSVVNGNINIRTHGLYITHGFYNQDNEEWNERGYLNIGNDDNERVDESLTCIKSNGLVIDNDYDLEGTGYLYLPALPSSDPNVSSAVFVASDGVLCMSGASYSPGGGGGGGSSNTYTNTFRFNLIETYNDGVVASFSELTIISALAPITDNNTYSYGDDEAVKAVGLAACYSTHSTAGEQTQAQHFTLEGAQDKTVLHADVFIDGISGPVGYGITNTTIYIGPNKYVFDTGDEAYVLDGQYISSPDLSVRIEITEPGRLIQIYDV